MTDILGDGDQDQKPDDPRQPPEPIKELPVPVPDPTKDDYEDGRYQDGDAVVLVAGGVRYTLGPLEEDDLDTIEQYLNENRKPALSSAKDVARDFDGLPPSMQQGLLDRLYADMRNPTKDRVSRQDVADWMDTFEGIVFSVFLQLRKNYPSITKDQVQKIVRQVGIAEAIRKRDQSSEKLTALADGLRKKVQVQE